MFMNIEDWRSTVRQCLESIYADIPTSAVRICTESGQDLPVTSDNLDLFVYEIFEDEETGEVTFYIS